MIVAPPHLGQRPYRRGASRRSKTIFVPSGDKRARGRVQGWSRGRIDPKGPAVEVDEREPTHLYAQVAGGIRRAIADGEARRRVRLAPATDLTTGLGVNSNTVLVAAAAPRAVRHVARKAGRRWRDLQACESAPAVDRPTRAVARPGRETRTRRRHTYGTKRSHTCDSFAATLGV